MWGISLVLFGGGGTISSLEGVRYCGENTYHLLSGRISFCNLEGVQYFGGFNDYLLWRDATQ